MAAVSPTEIVILIRFLAPAVLTAARRWRLVAGGGTAQTVRTPAVFRDSRCESVLAGRFWIFFVVPCGWFTFLDFFELYGPPASCFQIFGRYSERLPVVFKFFLVARSATFMFLDFLALFGPPFHYFGFHGVPASAYSDLR
jgi:hypothetical protein